MRNITTIRVTNIELAMIIEALQFIAGECNESEYYSKLAEELAEERKVDSKITTKK